MPTLTFNTLAEQLKPICEMHHVIRLRLFGSTVRGTDRPDSDVDILVDYVAGYQKTLESLDSLELSLSQVFEGRPIDLVDPDRLHWFIRDSVLSSTRVIYER